MSDFNTYCERTWLNKENSNMTSSMVAYHGKDWRDDLDEGDDHVIDPIMFIEIADCSRKINIHKSPHNTHKEFIDKLMLLSNEIYKFYTFLSEEYENVEKNACAVCEVTEAINRNNKKLNQRLCEKCYEVILSTVAKQKSKNDTQ